MNKNNKKILSLVFIFFIFTLLFIFSFIFEQSIKKETQNLEYNRFLEKLSIVVKELEYDKIEENKDYKRYDVKKDDMNIAYIYLENGQGVSGTYLIAVVIINENDENKIYNYTVLECSENDRPYVLKVLENPLFNENIKNKNINEEIKLDVVSEATISSNEIYNAIKRAIEKFNTYLKGEVNG